MSGIIGCETYKRRGGRWSKDRRVGCRGAESSQSCREHPGLSRSASHSRRRCSSGGTQEKPAQGHAGKKRRRTPLWHLLPVNRALIDRDSYCRIITHLAHHFKRKLDADVAVRVALSRERGHARKVFLEESGKDRAALFAFDSTRVVCKLGGIVGGICFYWIVR